MSKAILALVMLFSASAFAAKDPCLGTLIVKYRAMAKADPDWGYEWIDRVSKKDALELISYLEIEDFTEEDRAQATELVKTKGIYVYQLDWNAVGNRGSSFLITDTKTCKVVKEFAISSEE